VHASQFGSADHFLDELSGSLVIMPVVLYPVAAEQYSKTRLCSSRGFFAYLVMSLDDLEESCQIVPALDDHVDIPLIEKSVQRKQLIQRKAVFSKQIAQPDQHLDHAISRTHPELYDGHPWEPGTWRQFPLRGITALFLSLFCMAGSIAILYRSDGQPVHNWRVSPTVYLALLTTGANISLRFAFHQGVRISWWHSALKGATVRELHQKWLYGDTFWSDFFSGRNFNLVALASVATTLVVIDQPLIQRASTVISIQYEHPVNVTVRIAPEIPLGYTGFRGGRGGDQQVMTGPMIRAFNDFNSRNPMVTNFSGCTGTCTGYVKAGGLATQCSTISGPVTFLLITDNDTGSGYPESWFMAQSPFGTTFTLGAADPDPNGTSVTMVVSYTESYVNSCSGTMTQRTCSMRPATISYPITLQGDILSLGNIMTDSTVESFQPGGIDDGWDDTMWTIGGLYLAATTLFAANASYEWAGAHGNVMSLPDTLSNQFVQITANNDSADISQFLIPQPCNCSWGDPTTHILSSLNEIAFRVSLLAAAVEFRNTSQLPAPQILEMLQLSSINVFHSEYHYLLGSSLLSAFFVLLVAPTFWGWWKLGRSVTLNPIEIAKAFDAPFFQGPGSNFTEIELVRNTGSRLLRLADPQEISRPTPGAVYD
jgi:hypothetical protein